MCLAGKIANKAGIPIALDPVGVAAMDYRYHTVMRLLDEIHFSVIRGNLGEIATLAELNWQAKGVDTGNGTANIAEIAHYVANKYQCIVAVSGNVDYISDGKYLAKIANGMPLFPNIMASGCLLGSVLAAFSAVATSGQIFEATSESVAAYAIAGELAAKGLPTSSKEKHNPPIGLDFVKKACDAGIRKPIVSIGGVKAEHVAILKQNGANGIAVITAISLALDVPKAVNSKRLLEQAVFFPDFFAKFLEKTTACFFVLFLSKAADLK